MNFTFQKYKVTNLKHCFLIEIRYCIETCVRHKAYWDEMAFSCTIISRHQEPATTFSIARN
jgi:hypothetical protein